jgi:hypothetical protein
MNSLFSVGVFSLLLSMLVSCSTPLIMLDRAVILNATSSTITEVRVQHEPTGKIGAVNAILPGRTLSLGFSAQPMLAKEGVVTWRDPSGGMQSSRLTLPAYTDETKDISYTLVYTIRAADFVTVHLEK